MEPTRGERIQSRVGDGLIAAFETFQDHLVERVTRPKYEDAERIALDVLNKRIDALQAKPKPTQRDTELLALLKGIKAEMQRELDELWQNRPEQTRPERQR
jgi:hypothetical protein